jgi:hypothetical protein
MEKMGLQGFPFPLHIVVAGANISQPRGFRTSNGNKPIAEKPRPVTKVTAAVLAASTAAKTR